MKKLIVILFGLLVGTVNAQQEAQFSQYYVNPFYYNPAAAGLTNTMQFDGGFRRQWLNIEGSPMSTFVTGHSQIKFDKRKENVVDEFNTDKESVYASPSNSIGRAKHVVGGMMFNDQIGPFMKNSIMASYAYHLRFTEKTMLGLGMRAGWSNFGINSSKVILLEEDDIEYNNFLTRNSNQNVFDIQAGLTFYGEEFVFGVSTTQLLENDLVIDQIMTQSQLGRHWFAFGMYKFEMNDELTLEPHFMFQAIAGAPVSFNLGSRVHYNNRYWANLAYRFGDALNVGFGMNIAGNFRFGYAYDFSAGPVQRFNNNVHELSIGCTFGNNRNIRRELKNSGKTEKTDGI
jgi:type IX secretion system PorP/SprF family membrane protein